MLSDDRPTDPAWLPIFSKEEHFMGNAFGMIPGLEPDEWSNDACRGYVIMAMENCGFSKKDIRRVVGQLYEVFDLNSVEDAKEKHQRKEDRKQTANDSDMFQFHFFFCPFFVTRLRVFSMVCWFFWTLWVC